TLTDVLPNAGHTWTVGGADAASCSISAGTLTCSFGTMAPGSTKTITLTTTTTAADCANGLSNTATVSADVDTVPANNSSGAVLVTVNCPDVSVEKNAVSSPLTAGTSASFTVTVTAGGTGASTGVTLTDTLPGPATRSWVVAGDTTGCTPSTSPVAGGTTLTCSYGTMAAGTTKTITLTTTASRDDCASGITNTAS